MILNSINCVNFMLTNALGEKSEFGAKLEENGKIPDGWNSHMERRTGSWFWSIGRAPKGILLRILCQ